MMGIISYSDLIFRLQTRIYTDDAVSKKNKELLEQFLLTYDVSEARTAIFLERIHPFLKEFPDMSQLARESVNLYFFNLKEKYATATVATYASVLCRFCRWLNNGDLPVSCQDVVPYSRKRSRRKLDPKQMVTWEENIIMVRFTTSVQLVAISCTQLDGGFRPSEFFALNYGDISLIDGFFVAFVRDGKTGERNVVLFRATPYLKQWMDTHPSKNPHDPLWIDESVYQKTGKIVRYKYPAMAKRVKNLGKQARVSKPLDFYNLRHSSCVLDKKDNIPVELAAERHGHSVKYYMEVYGRLDVNDTVNRFKTHFGVEAGVIANPMQKYAVQPHIIKPTASEGEAQAQQYAIRCQIEQLQNQLDSMSSQQPAQQPLGLAPQYQHQPVNLGNPQPNMYSANASVHPPCGIPQQTQSSKSSHQ